MVSLNDPIYKIIKEIEKYEDTKDDIEIYNDINTIDEMICNTIPYNHGIIENIRKKYKNEIDNLNLMKKHFCINNLSKSSTIDFYQELLNLQHTLVRIQIIRLLERNGKKMIEEDLINNDNENLYNKFVLTMNS